jgi:glutamine synthetase
MVSHTRCPPATCCVRAELYEEAGLKPVVAPEVEFYLVNKNTDPDYELMPPKGRSGRREVARLSYSIDAVAEFEDFVEDMYDFADQQKLDVDTLIHENGAAQLEINFNHGDPLAMADQVFVFKRTVRETAQRYNMYATFMAKPMQREPGSALHIHQSVIDLETGQNIFATADGKPSQAMMEYMGGYSAIRRSSSVFMRPTSILIAAWHRIFRRRSI